MTFVVYSGDVSYFIKIFWKSHTLNIYVNIIELINYKCLVHVNLLGLNTICCDMSTSTYLYISLVVVHFCYFYFLFFLQNICNILNIYLTQLCQHKSQMN